MHRNTYETNKKTIILKVFQESFNRFLKLILRISWAKIKKQTNKVDFTRNDFNSVRNLSHHKW